MSEYVSYYKLLVGDQSSRKTEYSHAGQNHGFFIKVQTFQPLGSRCDKSKLLV